jgi:hypothetical protein
MQKSSLKFGKSAVVWLTIGIVVVVAWWKLWMVMKETMNPTTYTPADHELGLELRGLLFPESQGEISVLFVDRDRSLFAFFVNDPNLTPPEAGTRESWTITPGKGSDRRITGRLGGVVKTMRGKGAVVSVGGDGLYGPTARRDRGGVRREAAGGAPTGAASAMKSKLSGFWLSLGLALILGGVMIAGFVLWTVPSVREINFPSSYRHYDLEMGLTLKEMLFPKSQGRVSVVFVDRDRDIRVFFVDDPDIAPPAQVSGRWQVQTKRGDRGSARQVNGVVRILKGKGAVVVIGPVDRYQQDVAQIAAEYAAKPFEELQRGLPPRKE